MKPGLIYRINFQNFDNDYVRIDIADTTVQIPDADDPQVALMTGTGNPLHIRVIDNNEDKLTTIRAKQATIEFRSDVNFHIGTFADGPDNRFEVTCYLNPSSINQVFFRGFLVTSDLEQLFLPNPQVVVLTASDQIGLLKDITPDFIKGKFKMSYYIAACLKKTGLNLPIKVVNNKRVGSGLINITAGFTSAGGNNFLTTTAASFFYVGQRIRVTNSTSNNADFIVSGVGYNFFIGQIIAVTTTLVTEASNSVTIQDISSLSHIYDTVYIDSLTFEANIGTLENCYTILEKLLKDGETLTEYQGAWWVTSIDEYDANTMYVANFDADGNYINTEEIDLNKSVGANAPFKFATADNLLRLDRPKGSIIERFEYDFPQELICNQQFDRGDVIVPPDQSQPISNGRYELDCWEMTRLFGQPVTSTAEIRKTFEYGYEKDRYAVVYPKATSGATPWDFIKSSPLSVLPKYKVSINFEYRWETDLGSGGSVTHYPIRIWLKDKTGRIWHWWNPSLVVADFYWMSPTTNGTSPTDQDEKSVPDTFILNEYEDNPPDFVYADEGWRSISLDLGTIPTAGDLYIGLNEMRQGSSSGNDNQPVFYRPLSVQVTPYINGSYEQYSGQSYSVKTADPGYSAMREGQVFISNAPVESMKGAMFLLSGGGYYLTPRYYSSAPFALGPPTDQSVVNTYGYLQAFAVWNQNRNTIRKFAGTVLHLGENWPDIIHKFKLTDTNPNTDTRYFLLISFDQDWKSCLTSATFIEVYRFDGKVYTDPWSFKYITQ